MDDSTFPTVTVPLDAATYRLVLTQALSPFLGARGAALVALLSVLRDVRAFTCQDRRVGLTREQQVLLVKKLGLAFAWLTAVALLTGAPLSEWLTISLEVTQQREREHRDGQTTAY